MKFVHITDTDLRLYQFKRILSTYVHVQNFISFTILPLLSVIPVS